MKHKSCLLLLVRIIRSKQPYRPSTLDSLPDLEFAHDIIRRVILSFARACEHNHPDQIAASEVLFTVQRYPTTSEIKVPASLSDGPSRSVAGR